MSSTKEIRNRIKAIRNTAKITRAMQMVAASKMKKAQDATLKNRPYAIEAEKVLENLVTGVELQHPLMDKNIKVTKKLLVVVTSDKGLCGSFNAAVMRTALEYLKKNPETDLITIGKKAQNFFKKTKQNIIATFTDFPVSPHTRDVRPLVTSISDAYKKGEYQEVVFCFTIFESTLKQMPTLTTVLPLKTDDNRSFAAKIAAQDDNKKYSVVKFEPSPKEVINNLIPRILETTVYQIFLESIASEQSARMVAMKNATDAAGDLVEDLNLTYNSIRQASITQELAEISAGSNVKNDQ